MLPQFSLQGNLMDDYVLQSIVSHLVRHENMFITVNGNNIVLFYNDVMPMLFFCMVADQYKNIFVRYKN